MTTIQRAAEIRGKTMRWTWTDGPTKGTAHEHVFGADGTVTWRAVDDKSKGSERAQQKESAQEKAEYAAIKVADDIFTVSYLADSGYTLTVVLNFADHSLVGFASGAKDWHPVRGTFEVVE